MSNWFKLHLQQLSFSSIPLPKLPPKKSTGLESHRAIVRLLTSVNVLVDHLVGGEKVKVSTPIM